MRQTFPRVAIDWVPAFALAGVGLAEIGGSGVEHRLLLAVAVLGVTLPLGLRRDRPLMAYGSIIASLSTIAIVFPAYESLAILFSLTIGSYSVAQREETRPALVAIVLGAAAVAAAIARDPTDDLTNIPPSVLLFVVAPAGAGWVLRRKNTRSDALVRQTQEAAETERRRLARELHDVVAHAVTVMVIQAQAAQRLRLTRPEEELEALLAIEERGRRALVELRRLLDVLHSDEDNEGVREPQPGIARIASLAAEMRDAGLDVELRLEGDLAAVPAGVDVSTYRIVQEALTNTLRHAGSVRTSVHVRADKEAVRIQVLDEGSGVASSSGGGFGLIGMRERVRLLGGTIATGPRPQGGFAVNAELPL